MFVALLTQTCVYASLEDLSVQVLAGLMCVSGANVLKRNVLGHRTPDQ